MSEIPMEKALEDYFSSLLNEPKPKVKEKAQARSSSKPVAEKRAKPLAELLAKSPTAKTASDSTLPKVLPVFRAPEPVELKVVPDQPISKESSNDEVETVVFQPVWKNIDSGDEFQVLFFEVAGVTFGVPLTQLGGIHRMGDVNPLFGKPDWFAGVMLQREEKLNVVDTAKWVMPNKLIEANFKYLVMLDETQWGLACERLLGTERLSRDDVKWRSAPGRRPWLAGMVKQRMCALLHVHEFIAMLNNGININGC